MDCLAHRLGTQAVLGRFFPAAKRVGLMVGLTIQDTTLGTTVGNLGWEAVSFPKPVFAGDTIRAETKVLELRASKSRPGQGIVTFEHRAFNQRDEEVAYCRRLGLMLGRPR